MLFVYVSCRCVNGKKKLQIRKEFKLWKKKHIFELTPTDPSRFADMQSPHTPLTAFFLLLSFSVLALGLQTMTSAKNLKIERYLTCVERFVINVDNTI